MSGRGRAAVLGRTAAGYTLVELIVVMTIFLVVVTTLASSLVSGTSSGTDANRRFETQQNARLALERIRREVHCASAVSAVSGTLPGPLTAVRVSLPAVCPTSGGVSTTVVWQTVPVSARRWALRRTDGSGATVKVADFLTNDAVFTYYGPTTSSRARLHVAFRVNRLPQDPAKDWRLVDDIVLRNTTRS
ncbi:MAG: type II secretion system GspH family protein [Actinomycetota bacterium]|nr:type II secretion system GspH family protein [Actinomycetota bacterium]